MSIIDKNKEAAIAILILLIGGLFFVYYDNFATGQSIKDVREVSREFGVPWNVFSNNKEPVITVSPEPVLVSNGKARIAVSASGDFVDKDFFIYDPETKKSTKFTFDEYKSGSRLIKGYASKSIEISAKPGLTYQLLVKTCHKDSKGKVQCGCRTASDCNKMQLQTFTTAAQSAPNLGLSTQSGNSRQSGVTASFVSAESSKTPASRGYIIEYTQKPAVEYKKELKKQASQISAKRVGLSRISGLLEEIQIKSQISQYKKEVLEKEHKDAEDDIGARLVSKSGISGKRTGAKSLLEAKTLAKFQDTFNGIALDISKEEADEIKKSPYVKNVYPNYVVKTTLKESVPLIEADKAWEQNKFGRACVISQSNSKSGFAGFGVIDKATSKPSLDAKVVLFDGTGKYAGEDSTKDDYVAEFNEKPFGDYIPIGVSAGSYPSGEIEGGPRQFGESIFILSTLPSQEKKGSLKIILSLASSLPNESFVVDIQDVFGGNYGSKPVQEKSAAFDNVPYGFYVIDIVKANGRKTYYKYYKIINSPEIFLKVDLDEYDGPMLDFDKAQAKITLEDTSQCLTGKGIRIGIIDTGVDYTHPDLGGCFGKPNDEETSNAPIGLSSQAAAASCVQYTQLFDESIKNDAAALTNSIIDASKSLCAGEQAKFNAELKSLVRKRKELLAGLIQSNPDRALTIQELPASVLSKLSRAEREQMIEQRGKFEGTLEVLHSDDFKNPQNSKFIFYLKTSKSNYKLFSGKELPVVLSRTKVSVNGLGLNGLLAVDTSKGNFNILASPPTPSSENLGAQKTLVIVAGIGNNPAPAAVAEARSLVFDKRENTVQDFYKKNSYGKASLIGDVVGPYALDSSVCGSFPTLDAALNAAQSDAKLSEYERIILAVPCTACDCAGGFGTIGKWELNFPNGQKHSASVSWDFVFNLNVVGHELGHNFGSHHANMYYCNKNDGSAAAFSYECSSSEYGDRYSIMGKSPGHHTAPQKKEIGWLSDENIATATEGTYVLKALETIQPAGNIQMLRIPINIETSMYASDENLYYTIEYRQPLDVYERLDNAFYEGVTVRIAKFDESGGFTFKQTNLLDIDIHKIEYPDKDKIKKLKGKGKLAVKVIDTANNPVSEAIIWIDYYGIAVTSNEEGIAIFPEVPAGENIPILAYKSGYFRKYVTFSLNNGETKEIVITLEAGVHTELLKVGNTFRDEINGYAIKLDSITDNGAQVTVSRIPISINFNEPVAYYNFDDGTAKDNSGYTKRGAISGAIPKAGGLYFSGSDYVKLNSFSGVYIKENNRYTISLWANIENHPKNRGSIYSHSNGLGEISIDKQLIVKLSDNFETGNRNIGYAFITSDNPISLKKWHHIAGVYDGTNLILYIDGVEKKRTSLGYYDGNSITLDKLYNWYSESSNSLGGSEYTEGIKGIIDEFKIYARALSPQEVQDLYKSFTPQELPPEPEKKECKVVGGYDFTTCKLFDSSGECKEKKEMNNDPMDDQGHGTHVAATAAGNGALKGVAPDASIYAYKVLSPTEDGDGSGYISDIIAAIERSIDPNDDGDFSEHLDVISLSLGSRGGSPDDPVSKAIDRIVDAGVTAVVAAGNDGPYSSTIGSPGTARKAITVGASDKQDKIAGFSSRGPVVWNNKILVKPDVVAPGVDICAAQSSEDKIWQSIHDRYKTDLHCIDKSHISISGTSMATPHVSGAAALIKQGHPDWTPEEIKMALRAKAVDIGKNIYAQGYGRINAYKTVNFNGVPSIARLDTSGALSGIVDIKGTAMGREFSRYSLYYGSYYWEGGSQWTEVTTSASPVENVALYNDFDSSILKDGTNFLRLLVWNTNGEVSEDSSMVNVQNIDIKEPLDYDVYRVGDTLKIIGSIKGNFESFSVEYTGEDLDYVWSKEGIKLANVGKKEIIDDTIAVWDTSSITKSGSYSIRISVKYKSTIKLEERVVYLDSTLRKGWPQKINWWSEDANDVSIKSGSIKSLEPAKSFTKTYSNTANTNKENLVQTQNIMNSREARVYNHDQFAAQISRKSVYRPGFLSPVVSDINNDGKKEIIIYVKGKPTRLYAYEENGELLDGWPKEIKDENIDDYFTIADFINSLSVGDLNNDGFKEIVLNGFNGLYLYNHNGSFLRFLDLTLAYQPATENVLYDLNNDGKTEIIKKFSDYNQYDIGGTETEKLAVLDINGNILDGWPKVYYPIVHNNWRYICGGVLGGLSSTPAIGNFDNDPEKEIVVAGMRNIFDDPDNPDDTWHCGGRVNVYNMDGSTLNGFPVDVNGAITDSPAVADINNDGYSEIVATSDYGEDNSIYVIDRNGKFLDGWPYPPPNSDIKIKRITSPSVGDLDKDGYPEIAVISNSLVYVFNYKGKVMSGWPQAIPDDSRSVSLIDLGTESPVIGDVNGDGKNDVAAMYAYYIYAWNSDGSLIEGFPKTVSSYTSTSAVIADIDGDGSLELIASDGGNDFSSIVNHLYVWELSSKNTQIEWPMFMHDPQHTGYYNSNKEKKEDRCTDSDGGLNYYVTGATSKLFYSEDGLTWRSIVPDSCSGDILNERYCDNKGNDMTSYYSCPNGCKDGACSLDFNRNSVVDDADWQLLVDTIKCVGIKDSRYDLNRDGSFDSKDLDIFQKATGLVGAIDDRTISLCPSHQDDGNDDIISKRRWLVRTDTNKLEISEDRLEGKSVETLRDIKNLIGKNELKMLDSGRVINNKGASDYEQQLEILGQSAETDKDTGYVVYTENDFDTAADFLYFRAGKEIGTYTIEFTPSLKSSIANNPVLNDFKNVEIKLFDKKYTLIKAIGVGNGISLTLMSGAGKATLLEKQTKIYTVSGRDYDVTLKFIDDEMVQFIVKGETTIKLKEGDIYKLSDGTAIGVIDILYQGYARGANSATFSMGAEKLELADININDAAPSYTLKANDNRIDNAFIVIEGKKGYSLYEINKIKIIMKADNNLYIPAGNSLSGIIKARGYQPEVLFTNRWDILYAGLSNVPAETIKLNNVGSTQYNLELIDSDGSAYLTVPIAKITSPNTLAMGDKLGGNFVNSEDVLIKKEDYFVIKGMDSRGKSSTRILKYKGTDSANTPNPKLIFKDIGSNSFIEMPYSKGSSLATLNAGNFKRNVYLGDVSNTLSSDFGIKVDLDGSGKIEKGNTVNIITNYGLEISLRFASDRGESFINATFNTPADKVESMRPSAITALIEDTGGTLKLEMQTSLNLRTPSGEDGIVYGYTHYGDFISYSTPASEPAKLKIEHPEVQRVPLVYIGEAKD